MLSLPSNSVTCEDYLGLVQTTNRASRSADSQRSSDEPIAPWRAQVALLAEMAEHWQQRAERAERERDEAWRIVGDTEKAHDSELAMRHHVEREVDRLTTAILGEGGWKHESETYQRERDQHRERADRLLKALGALLNTITGLDLDGVRFRMAPSWTAIANAQEAHAEASAPATTTTDD